MNARLQCFCQLADLNGSAGWMTQTRRHIHQHPELSFQEEKTAALVSKNLKSWGWDVTEGVGGHGVVGTLTCGTGAKRIALRAESDGPKVDAWFDPTKDGQSVDSWLAFRALDRWIDENLRG